MAVFNPNRTFGVEIETNTRLTPAELAGFINRGFRADGINQSVAPNAGSYSHANSPQWKIVSDTTIGGWEVVSPILSGTDGEAQIKSVCKSLKEAGVSVDRRTGLHIHHEARDLSAKAIGQTFALYATFQDLINYMVSPSRRGRGYGTPIDWERITANGTDDFDGDRRSPGASGSNGNFYPVSIENKMRQRMTSSRYNSVNIEAVLAHGTIEFRQHQGTINGTKIWNWILLTQSIIEAAIEMRKPVKPTKMIRAEGKVMAYRAKGEFHRFREVIKPSPSANGVPLSHATNPELRWDIVNEQSKIYMGMMRYWGKRIKEFGFQEYA